MNKISNKQLKKFTETAKIGSEIMSLVAAKFVDKDGKTKWKTNYLCEGDTKTISMLLFDRAKRDPALAEILLNASFVLANHLKREEEAKKADEKKKIILTK